MTKLPIVFGNQVIKAFQKIGYYIRNQKGNHVHLRNFNNIPITIPNHREITRGTLGAIIT